MRRFHCLYHTRLSASDGHCIRIEFGVDFNANASLVAQLGGTICPTYVLFQNGEPVLTRSYPISMDLLEGEVARLTVGQTSNATTRK